MISSVQFDRNLSNTHGSSLDKNVGKKSLQNTSNDVDPANLSSLLGDLNMVPNSNVGSIQANNLIPTASTPSKGRRKQPQQSPCPNAILAPLPGTSGSQNPNNNNLANEIIN